MANSYSLNCYSDSGFIPIFVYAIFGSSRQLAIGPVALTSLLVSNVLGKIVDSSEELYTELAILLALMVGVLECIMGLLRCLDLPSLLTLSNLINLTCFKSCGSYIYSFAKFYLYNLIHLPIEYLDFHL